jgi:hypothetical protein
MKYIVKNYSDRIFLARLCSRVKIIDSERPGASPCVDTIT